MGVTADKKSDSPWEGFKPGLWHAAQALTVALAECPVENLGPFVDQLHPLSQDISGTELLGEQQLGASNNRGFPVPY
jgi:hypothetical protein